MRHSSHLANATRTSTAGLIEPAIKASLLAQKQVKRMKVVFTSAVMDHNRRAVVRAAMVVVEVAAMAVVDIRHIAETNLPTNDSLTCDRATSDRTMTDSTTKKPM
jgi:hypothetical protein